MKKKTKIIYKSRQMKITAIKQILMDNSVKSINRPNKSILLEFHYIRHLRAILS